MPATLSPPQENILRALYEEEMHIEKIGEDYWLFNRIHSAKTARRLPFMTFHALLNEGFFRERKPGDYQLSLAGRLACLHLFGATHE